MTRRALRIAERDGWTASLPIWRKLSLRRSQGRLQTFPLRELLRALPVNRSVDQHPFQIVSPRNATKTSVRYCVYTALFGDYDDLKLPLYKPENVDFICFTDQMADVPGWQTIQISGRGNPNLQAKHFKLFPHVHLQSYEASLFVDASTAFHGRIDRFVARWLAHENFVMWTHSARCDAFAEAAAVLIYDKERPEQIVRQVDAYREAGLPRNTGLVEASFIWRRHDDPDVQRLMDLWWEEIGEWSLRDQISLCFLMWRTKIRPKVLPPSLGQARRNSIAFAAPHRPRPKRLSVAKRPKRIAFVYRDKSRSTGSTVLRGQQLAEITRTSLGDQFDVSFTPAEECTDAIVFLTKGFLTRATEAELHAIKSQNVAVLADFVDSPVRLKLLPFIDVLIASSIEGWRKNLWRSPKTDCEVLTHHVDLRIPENVAAQHVFAAGYFGEPINALRTEKLESVVDFIHVDTKHSDPGWMDLLGAYNLHYAVRPETAARGSKPFLKGFTAAHCGANIVVSRLDGDALYYLGDDYPFLIDRAEPAAAFEMVDHARESFDGPEWRRGLEIMQYVKARSTAAQVAQELRRILKRWA